MLRLWSLCFEHCRILWHDSFASLVNFLSDAIIASILIQLFSSKGTLEEESPEYIKWVERKDDLSELTEKQVRFLCASILATPTYREDGFEFSLKWITDDQHTINYVEKLLAFNNRVYNMKVWRTECALCKAFVDGDNDDGDYTNLYFTRTYDDKNSVLVWKERNGKIFLSKYFKDIHILKNVRENIDDRMLREYQYISERVHGNESTDEILIES